MQFPRIVPLSWHQSCKDIMLRVAPTKRDFWLDRMISEMFLAYVSTYFMSHVHICTSFMSFSINFVLARICFRTCHLWSNVAHSILPYRFSGELTAWDWVCFMRTITICSCWGFNPCIFEFERSCIFVHRLLSCNNSRRFRCSFWFCTL